MQDNPYQSNLGGDRFTDAENQSSLVESVKLREDLVSIARWQSFFGFLGLCVCFILGITGILQVLFLFGVSGAGGSAGLVSFGFFVLLLIAYGLPTSKLLRASRSARRCAQQAESISQMIESQQVFWRTLGTIFCIFLGFYAAILTLAFGLGFSSVSNFF